MNETIAEMVETYLFMLENHLFRDAEEEQRWKDNIKGYLELDL